MDDDKRPAREDQPRQEEGKHVNQIAGQQVIHTQATSFGAKHVMFMVPNFGVEGVRVNKIDTIHIISAANSVWHSEWQDRID
jgi:hypothetical protein